MIKNYFKTAWRNILNNKFYSAINITGLTLGLTVGLLILLWVNDELSFDRFNTRAEHLYQMDAQIGTGSSKQLWAGVQGPVATYALKEVPGVKNAVRIIYNFNYSVFRYKERLLSTGENGNWYVDPSFFKVFDFKLLKGNINAPFPNDKSIIITESTAKRFFGDADPMGKALLGDNKDNYIVAGLMADPPENSSIKFDMLFSIDVRKKQYSRTDYWKSMDEDWGNYYTSTFLLLQPGTSTQAVADKLTKIHVRHQPGPDAAKVKYQMQPFTQIHLYNPDGSASGMQTVRIFLIVAVFILLIACINYVNLSTARAMLRSKEVSIRKIIGAEKKQLFAQFVIETVLFFSMALVLAFAAIEILMPLYNTVSGKQMQFNLFDAGVWKVIGLTVLATLTASSIYPALLLSSFKPISALKGKISLGVGNVAFRKILVVTQFIFSIGLIIGTIIINSQLKYIREKELGYDKSYVFSFGMRDMQKNYEGVRTELLNRPGVYGVTSSSDNIVNIGNNTGDTDWDGKDPNSLFLIHPMYIDKYYLDVFKVKMAAGKGFAGYKTDSAHFILNETAVRATGITNPVGKRFKLHDINGTIIGVVRDFHFASLKQKIEPAIFAYQPGNNWRISIRTTGKDASKAIAAAAKIWKQYNPAFPFEYKFLDDDYNNLYKTDQRSGTLFSAFAAIAILISCLGLFGLATYTAQVKIKEIGIRKVLGASVSNITAMLSKDFLILVVISLIIATPVAWFAMYKWLQDYAYRITIQWWVFAIAGVTAITIAFITMSFQAIKAALANPVKSLRSE
ncbi:ABC transporter permease [Mucilaginibacter gotjawali]|uniref:ABC transport system permease protein n=2 Tax=Mucilaginibacter gotjawali TaxID=1550579 RepID=A0A839SDM8_9SPHI|nr:ABC transporter permease [Mucilaginibacter gotjawali]MBB3055678.1 putative ABC transport system permease protein [Mucilaginibacter gotjawali]BAU54497.1 macrolide transporter ATP-binding /permease protein [Mucilaginibacter gotjawali]